MPCDSRRDPGETRDQRRAKVSKSLAQLEAMLTFGTVKVEIGPNGAVVFKGWQKKDRSDVTDVCAYRTLAAKGSWALRRAIAAAEVRAGRQVNEQAIAEGYHSHDGGKTWGKH